MKNTSIAQIAQILGIGYQVESLQVSGFQVDSRNVCQGDLFFALEGERADGHQFLAQARSKGACAAVVDREYRGPDHGLILLSVESVLDSLQRLARFDIENNGIRVIGITGSVGKTTTKDFLAEILKAKYRVGKTPQNYNTKLTLPLSVLNRDGGEELLVLEMGMSEPGDIGRLLQIAQPEVAVVTKIALAHAKAFPNGLRDIAKGKAEIFSSPKLKSAIFDHGLTEFVEAMELAPIEKRVSFSLENRSADYFFSAADGKNWVDERGVRAYQFIERGIFEQKHILHNFLAASVAARQMKLEWDEINARIPYLELPKMRFECWQKQGITYINDAYNANPESMRAALESLPKPKEGGKRIGVLGKMAELGPFSEEAHRNMGLIAQKTLDYLLVLGEEALPLFESFREIKKPAELFTDLPSLAKRLEALMTPGDVVLVKGSRVMQMETIFELLSLRSNTGG